MSRPTMRSFARRRSPSTRGLPARRSRSPWRTIERVRQGQVLFRIDPEPYQIAVDQAEARLGSARLQIELAQGDLSPATGGTAIGQGFGLLRRA